MHMKGITSSERKMLIRIINVSLLLCKADDELSGFINLFYFHVREDLEDICRLRIQDLVLRSVINGDFESNFYQGEDQNITNEIGMLAESIAENILLFQNREDIIKAMYNKLINGGLEEYYVLSTFSKVVFQLEIPVPKELEKKIRLSLDKNLIEENNTYIAALKTVMNVSGDNQWKQMFGDQYKRQYD